MTKHPRPQNLRPQNTPDDLPEASAAAIANSMMNVVREAASVEIGVVREMLPCRGVNVSEFVVTLPAGLTEEQRVEIDYWLREVCGNIRYGGE